MLEQQTFALQCLTSLANSLDIRAAIQFISITSTEERAQMQVSSNDRSERTIVFTVPIFAEGQINEERLHCNVMLKAEKAEKAGDFQTPQTLC